MAEVSLVIEGMHCGACVRRVSQALAATEGLQVEEVRVGAARVSTTDAAVGTAAAVAALEKIGFQSHPMQ